MSPAETFEIVTEGRIERVMPPWEDALSESERWDVVYGAWSFYLTPTRLARAEAEWGRTCASCHGGGQGQTMGEAPSEESLADPVRLAGLSGAQIKRAILDEPAHTALDFGSDVEGLWLAIDHVRGLGFETLPYDDLSADGQIQGLVVNGTETEVSVDGTVVRAAPLGVAIPGEIISTTLEDDGTFLFEGIVTGPQVEHRLSAIYAGVEYISDLQPTGDTDDALGESDDLVLEVFEQSTDVPIIASALHAVVAPASQRGMLEVVERWTLSNASDRARISDSLENPTASLGLLAGAIDVQVHDGAPEGSMIRVGDSMLDLRPIPPGGREVVLIYDVPYTDDEAEITRRFGVAVDVHTITSADENAEVQSEWALRSEQIDLMGRDVQQIVGGPFGVGDVASARLGGLLPPVKTTTRPSVQGATDGAAGTRPERVVSQRSISRVGLFGLAMVMLIAGVYPFAARRRGPLVPLRRLERQRTRVLERLAELEQKNMAGELAPRRYALERAGLMERAIAVERQLDALRAREPKTDHTHEGKT